MRKIVLLFAVAVSVVCSGCYSTASVIYPQSMQQSLGKIEQQMQSHGYLLTGSSRNDKTETVVTGVSFTPSSGYGTAMDNKITLTDSYFFSDSLGNTVEFTLLTPEYKKDINGMIYTEEFSVAGCRVSKAKDYNTLCNDVVKATISDTKRDEATVYDPEKTVVASSLIILLACMGILFYVFI